MAVGDAAVLDMEEDGRFDALTAAAVAAAVDRSCLRRFSRARPPIKPESLDLLGCDKVGSLICGGE